jgi:hypothetical protein
MKKLIIPCILFVLVAAPIVLADSSVTMETMIDESLHVTFNFTNIEDSLYNEIQAQGFNISTIPNAVEEKFKQQNLTNARVIYALDQEIFNVDTHSIHVEFLLTGPDIISYTLNKSDMARTFHVRTDWRKFKINLTNDFQLDFGRDFEASLDSWQKVTVDERVAFEKNVEDEIEMTFRFILPKEAFNVQVEEDTIIFKVPLTFEDVLLNSPFLVLGAIIIVNIIAVAYRKARR